MSEPWCVLLVSQADAYRGLTSNRRAVGLRSVKAGDHDPLISTLRRANNVAPLERIAALVTAPSNGRRQQSLAALGVANLLIEPKHRGTGHQILLALLQLAERVPPATPILFLPVDHVVEDERVMTCSLKDMAKWIGDDPTPVYVLGAAPQGPHDELGYILPWHDAMHMPSVVYEFVERPDIYRARKLINAGGLWNTFIFGGTLDALINLFRPKFDASITALRAALGTSRDELDHVYDALTAVDFSTDVLAQQCDTLNVLRLPPCGWWPLKSPTLNRPARVHPLLPRMGS